MQVLAGLDKLIPIHPQRKRVYDKFYSLLNHNINEDSGENIVQNLGYKYIEDDIKKMSINIERGIFNHTIRLYKFTSHKDSWNEYFKSIYTNRATLVYNNLDPNGSVKNIKLLQKFLSKEFNEFEMCYFDPEQMFPEKYKQLVELHCPERFKDLPEPLERPDGILKCGKCKSYKTEYTERQTRSADEPTTKFCYCHNCQHRWRFC